MAVSSTEKLPVEDDKQPTTDTTGDSSAASPAAPEPKSMLEAVTAALQPKDASAASQTPEPDKPDPETPDDPSKPSEPTEEADPVEEPPEDEKKHWSAKTTRRFQRLSSGLRDAQREVEDLKPHAEEFRQIDTFCRENNISPEDMSGTLQIAALLKSGDYRGALQKLTPIVSRLNELTGQVLPDDLRQRVEWGQISQDDALSLSRAKADAAAAQQRATMVTQQRVSDQRAQETRASWDATNDAVVKWERTKSADPDFKLKQQDVADQVALALERGRNQRKDPMWFPTPKEAIEISEAALKTVTERVRRYSPKPQEIKPFGTDTSAATNSATEPKTMAEAIKQVLRRK